MKILLVQDTDWVTRNIHQQHHVMERLRLRGYDVTVIDHDLLWRSNGNRGLISKRRVFTGLSKAVDNADITVVRPRIVRVPFFDYVSMLITYTREISAQFRESPPDVVVGMYLLANYLALRLARRHGVPFIFQVLEPYCEMIPSRLLRPLGKMIESEIFQRADHVVVINEGLKEYAVRMGARHDRVSVIRAGIDLERFGPHVHGRAIRQRYGIREHETVLLFMGWLYPFSGLQELLMEMAKRTRDDPSVRLLIVGDGDSFQELRRMRSDLGLERWVTLTGKQRYADIPKFVAASDICLLPAHNNEIMRDIVPIKMYEYMAMGKPVIATKLPGIMKEFGINNGVVYIDRPEDALNKAEELIRTNSIKIHGDKARRFTQSNDWDAVVDQFEKTLRDVTIESNEHGSKSSHNEGVGLYHDF